MSRHTSTALSMAAASASATALGILPHRCYLRVGTQLSTQRQGLCAAPLRLSHPGLGGDIMISHSQGSFQRDSAGSYRPTQASGFHGWERPNIGGFRLYTLRRAQPLYKCWHTQWPS